ncbi:hypothetical protein ADIARSV_2624 [Arcticibacter svalbardensis MN12-7]|uniref:Uncharacterized protein n=1 Tax=Arcticibacter svalbardensis MN12-7 TaxID=1150600 RepID=R9GR99_9SPHI|nr:hypothetical protein ADIARSV_2624 [Arcticibacter svalbardensis MN12-7]
MGGRDSNRGCDYQPQYDWCKEGLGVAFITGKDVPKPTNFNPQS